MEFWPMFDWVLRLVLLAALVINVLLCVANLRAYWQLDRLNRVLFECASTAFVNQHLPIWVPWARYSRQTFTVTLVSGP